MTRKTTAATWANTGTSTSPQDMRPPPRAPGFNAGRVEELVALTEAGERLRNLSQIERASVEPLRIQAQLLIARCKRITSRSDDLRHAVRGAGALSGQV